MPTSHLFFTTPPPPHHRTPPTEPRRLLPYPQKARYYYIRDCLANISKGYWLAIYTSISITEHFLFKRGISGYDLTIYQNARLLPPGFAAILAFCFGVFGAVMGMSQVYYIGPIGKLIGDPAYGGDVGFPLAFGFAGVSYAILRAVERRVLGR